MTPPACVVVDVGVDMCEFEWLVVRAWWGLFWQRFGAVRWCEVQLVCCECCIGFP